MKYYKNISITDVLEDIAIKKFSSKLMRLTRKTQDASKDSQIANVWLNIELPIIDYIKHVFTNHVELLSWNIFVFKKIFSSDKVRNL